MECEFLTRCEFIKKATEFEPFTVKMIRMSYCEQNKLRCARYRLSLSVPEKDIPDDLWPNSEEDNLSLDIPLEPTRNN